VLLARFALRPAKNSLQFQKRFIGNVAHEIRTPLAIVKTSTEVALMDPSLSKDLRATLDDTIIELDRVSETINNLLSFDNLIRPRRLVPAAVDLGAIIDTVVDRHQTLAASRGISLIVDKSEHLKVLGNATALDQVVTNLVKNAITYTPKDKDGVVTITLGTDIRGSVVLTISDTGIGIAQKDLYHIFEPFYRGDTSRARGVGTGTSGLGLAIVNEIVRLHRGSITIRSALGEGTSFRVTLPRAEDITLRERMDIEHHRGDGEVSVDFSRNS
jgi:signal transduction histidine kinase